MLHSTQQHLQRCASIIATTKQCAACSVQHAAASASACNSLHWLLQLLWLLLLSSAMLHKVVCVRHMCVAWKFNFVFSGHAAQQQQQHHHSPVLA